MEWWRYICIANTKTIKKWLQYQISYVTAQLISQQTWTFLNYWFDILKSRNSSYEKWIKMPHPCLLEETQGLHRNSINWFFLNFDMAPLFCWSLLRLKYMQNLHGNEITLNRVFHMYDIGKALYFRLLWCLFFSLSDENQTVSPTLFAFLCW